MLASAHPGVQDVVVAGVTGQKAGPDAVFPAPAMAVGPGQVREFVLFAYCLDWEKDNPSGSTTFTIGGQADPDVRKILAVLDSLPRARASVTAVQIAIWSVTSPSLTRTELAAKFPASPGDIADARFILEKAGVPIAGKSLF